MKKQNVMFAMVFLLGCAGAEGGGSQSDDDDDNNGGQAGDDDDGAAGGSGGTASDDGGSGGAASDGGSGGAADNSGGSASGGSAGSNNGGSMAMAGMPAFDKSQPCTDFEGTIRDFTTKHPDFYFETQYKNGEPFGSGRGMVKEDLDGDGKPVLAVDGPWMDSEGIAQVTSQATFSQWYRDTEGMNMPIALKMKLEPRANGLFWMTANESPMDASFYPIDGKGFGNTDWVDGAPSPADETVDAEHNTLLTYEMKAEFLYQGGEIIITESDDDSWIFINGKLAVDNGGLHGFIPATGKLDTIAERIGLEKGKKYSISFFYTDRQMPGGGYRISTNVKFTHCEN